MCGEDVTGVWGGCDWDVWRGCDWGVWVCGET